MVVRERECLCRRRRRRCVCLKRPFPRVLMAFEFHPRSAIRRPRAPLSVPLYSPPLGDLSSSYPSQEGRQGHRSLHPPSKDIRFPSFLFIFMDNPSLHKRYILASISCSSNWSFLLTLDTRRSAKRAPKQTRALAFRAEGVVVVAFAGD